MGLPSVGSQRQARRRTVQSELEQAARASWAGGARAVDPGRPNGCRRARASGRWRPGPGVAARAAQPLRDALECPLAGGSGGRRGRSSSARASTRGSMPYHDATATMCVAVRSGIRWTIAWPGACGRRWSLRDLQRAARLLIGSHDFGAFGSAARKGGDTRRTVLRIGVDLGWTACCSYQIAADGFLYRMVRRLVFVQVAMGQGSARRQVLSRGTGKRSPGAGSAGRDGPAAGSAADGSEVLNRGVRALDARQSELKWRSTVQKTYYPKAAEIEHKWYVADAAGQNLGRLASRVAHALLGKHKPSFTPGVQGGDYVVVINAEQVTVTGTKTSLKLDSKMYHHHSGYPGRHQDRHPARSAAHSSGSCSARRGLGHAAAQQDGTRRPEASQDLCAVRAILTACRSPSR